MKHIDFQSDFETKFSPYPHISNWFGYTYTYTYTFNLILLKI